MALWRRTMSDIVRIYLSDILNNIKQIIFEKIWKKFEKVIEF